MPLRIDPVRTMTMYFVSCHFGGYRARGNVLIITVNEKSIHENKADVVQCLADYRNGRFFSERLR